MEVLITVVDVIRLHEEMVLGHIAEVKLMEHYFGPAWKAIKSGDLKEARELADRASLRYQEETGYRCDVLKIRVDAEIRRQSWIGERGEKNANRR